MYTKARLHFGQASDGNYVVFEQMRDDSFARTFKGTYEGMMVHLETMLRILVMSTPNIMHDIIVYAPPVVKTPAQEAPHAET